MRETEFYRRVTGEFGHERGTYLVNSHILSGTGRTAADFIESGEDPAVAWELLVKDFDVPPERWLGPDE